MKINSIYAGLACVAIAGAFASCSEVTEPVYQEPDQASFKMLTPPLQNQYYELTEEGTFNLTLNGQPSYGFSAVTQYRAQVSLTGKFDTEADYRELVPTGTGTQSAMTLNDIDLAEAICDLRGIKSREEYTDAGVQTIYFRGAAFIDGVESSYVTTSNVVTLNKVQSFFSVAQPGSLYVIGNYAGAWISPEEKNVTALEPYTLFEKADEIRSKHYYGSVYFDPTATESDAVIENSIFRFYTALTGWEDDSVGASGGEDADKPVEFDGFTSGSTLEHGLAMTKDSFNLKGYRGGIDMDVNIAEMKAIFKALD